MTAVDDVRDRIDIVDVVGDYVQLRKSGRNFTGRCPFHEERTPSFMVSPDRGTWRCFGACGVGGDVFDFVMRIENVDFRGALELLARRVGVSLDPPDKAAAQRQALRERYRSALDAAADFFHRQLLDTGPGAPARAYLERRRFTAQAVGDFVLGWAPDAWTATADALRARGFANDEMLAAGLVRPREGGGVFDTFRGRLTFPIRDVRGRVIGFGARTLDPEGVPKYLNSPQGELFDKSQVLYGIDRAARAIRESARAVVVEGYTDVIRAHAAGYTDVVASLGTALTEHHVTQLKRHAATTIVLALDADAAGQAATLRGLDVAREATAGDAVPVPTAHGWVRYEQRQDVELKVAVLPAGMDPDDVVRDDPPLWARLIEEARPVMVYLFDALTAGLDLDAPRGKTEAADRLLPVIAAMPDPVARAAWLARLSDLIHVDERALGARIPASDRPSRPRRTRDRQAPSAAAEGDVDASPGKVRAAPAAGDVTGWVLGHLLLDPRRLTALIDRLHADDQPPLSPADLDDTLERDLLEAVRLATWGAPPPDAPPRHRLDALPEGHAALAAQLRRRAAADPPTSEIERIAALRGAVLRLRERALKRELEGLRHVMTETPEERARYGERVRDVTVAILAVQRLVRPEAQEGGKLDSALWE